MSADEGLAWGFWNRLADDVHAAALELARDIAAGPSFAHAVTKRQLDAEWDVGIETALDMEAEAQALCMATKDFRRAYEAFAAKRRPDVLGRRRCSGRDNNRLLFSRHQAFGRTTGAFGDLRLRVLVGGGRDDLARRLLGLDNRRR